MNEAIKKVIIDRLNHYGTSLLTLADKTGIKYAAVYNSLGNGKRNNRPLRPNEFIAICKYLGLELKDFNTEVE